MHITYTCQFNLKFHNFLNLGTYLPKKKKKANQELKSPNPLMKGQMCQNHLNY